MRTDGMPSVDSISRAVLMANNSLSANVIGKSVMAAVCSVACAHRDGGDSGGGLCVDLWKARTRKKAERLAGFQKSDYPERGSTFSCSLRQGRSFYSILINSN